MLMVIRLSVFTCRSTLPMLPDQVLQLGYRAMCQSFGTAHSLSDGNCKCSD